MTKPILWTSAEAEAATGGRSSRVWEASGVSIDSRTAAPGDLFIAVQGPRFDGHGFVSASLTTGAAAAMVHRPMGGAGDGSVLTVIDTTKGLNDLARAARTRVAARIVAVTGSVGKTGTKEMLKLVLGRQAETTANLGNLNNNWGVPLSLARMPRDTAYGIFEIGMNHAGEIGPLSRMVRPDVAIITTVEPAHMEFFASIEAIADAKAEIFEGLGKTGVAVLNRDNPHFARLAAAAKQRGSSILGFGAAAEAEVRLESCEIDAEHSDVIASVLGRTVEYRIGVPGRHWVMNSLSVLAAVSAMGADVEEAARALADAAAPEGRGRRYRIAAGNGPFDLIDESYNANPAAMRAAFETLSAARPANGGRRIAILGDMLELGAGSAVLHASLAHSLETNKIDLVFTAGRQMGHLRDALPARMRGGHAADAAALAPLIHCVPRDGDVILVKGSAGSRMGQIVDALLKLDDAVQNTPRAANGG